MNNSLKPAARLTVIFILAIILSGSVLAYFSVNNISNLKELTEKKILEEQRELAVRFSSEISRVLKKVTSGLIAENKLPGEQKEAILNKAGEFIFIIQPFMLGSEGQFIYPNFRGIQETLSASRPSEMFASSFYEGENAEFTEKDLRAARNHYQLSLDHSSDRSDSARVLNALGRVSIKMNNFESAINYYSVIIKDCSKVTDANGLNYSYYALPQLLKITDQSNFMHTLPAILQFLEKIETGEIPLNYGTEELLALIPGYLEKIGPDSTGNAVNINRLAANIRKQSQFISIYGEELKELVTKGNTGNHPAASNEFIVADPTSGMTNTYLLINTSLGNPIGFLIECESLLETVKTNDLQAGLEFDYKIDFPVSFKSDAPVNDLVYTSQLHPWFPDQQIEISLVDKNLLIDIVSRRSWIYGLTSVMLLVAMCLGVVLILRDIARERNLSRLRADFISNVTHELKTPLTSIRMYAESLILGRVKSGEGQKEYLSVIVNESDRLKRMVNNILEFSKMKKGRSEYHFVNSNLASVVKASIHDMNFWFEREEFEVVNELDENIYADVDPEKIKQALGNLFSNAIKYSTDTKKVFIRLFKETDHVCIEVEDRGIGIPVDKLSRIFEEFYRIEQREGVSGTGLGLTVVKEIIEAHNGKISVTSEVGKGSKFVLVLNQQPGNSENNPGN